MYREEKFDVVVIGGGPGGYVAAIKAAHHAKRVALIEKGDLGGTCLNVGCIPTKALIANAHLLHKIRQAEEYGISVGKVSFDFAKMTERKDGVVGQIRSSLGGLIKSHNVTIFRGHGRFVSPREIKVLGEDNVLLKADKTIVATGSEPRNMEAFPFDYERIHSSTSILDLKELPKKLVIVGGGWIGCEAACLYQALGVEVVIVEMLPTIIATEGKELAQTLTDALVNQGIAVRTQMLVEGIDHTKTGISVRLKGHEAIDADMALVAIGRKLNTDDVGLEQAGIVVEPNGVIPVNDRLETNVPGIYAIGDVTAKWLLAHVASHQGMIAAENATGGNAKMAYNAVPSVIFTYPEIATVGYTLEKAKEKGYDAVAGRFPFMALGKSVASLDTEGFAQIVTDRKTGEILGAQVVGHEASTLIAEMAVAIANELTIESIADTIHAHPTIAEGWLEAALVANDTPIHLPPRRKK